MNVKQLIGFLSEFDDDLEIILASDSEGNSYSPLDDLDLGVYSKTNSWSGEISHEDEDEPDNAIVLYPAG